MKGILTLLIVFMWFFVPVTEPSMAAPAYRIYAEKLAQELPGSVVVRPDLEKVLDSLAQSARAAKKRGTLSPSAQFKIAARAQAIDMVLGDYVGHRSRKGHSFHARFEAFAGDSDLYSARGENAARERSDGPANDTKARRLFQQWLDSGGHRRNMMNRSYNRVSSGVVQKGDHLYAVQIFWSEPEG
jgi:uncharacterized protein YkwD